MNRVRELLRQGRGQSLAQVIENLNPILRGWMAYFCATQSRRPLEELDGWVRRRLRCLLWRQWKTPNTRRKRLIVLGLTPERAWKSACNGRGPWWNSGASHLNTALPSRFFTQLGLVSLLATQRRLQRVT